MTITSSGIMCDVCGKYILLEEYHGFTLRGFDEQFHCHSSGDCKDLLFKANTDKDWKILPIESPIRKAYEKIDVDMKKLINDNVKED